MSAEIMQIANECLNCKNPSCVKGCPVNTPIPQIIGLVKEGKLDEAGKMLVENNPMTTLCCQICDHEKQCEGSCIKAHKGNPVKFHKIEEYVSSLYAEKMSHEKKKKASNGIKIAVIGAGPAGLTAAILLAGKGYEITIFDKESAIGGMMRYGIPEYRLQNADIDKLWDSQMNQLPIYFRANSEVGKTVSIDDLYRDGYSAIFAAAGLWKSRKLGIPGDSSHKLTYGIEYLKSPESFKVGNKVAIIGVGNSAIDAARTALRQGAKQVTCYARRDGITACTSESEAAKFEGIEFVFCHKPVEITEEGVIFRSTQKQEDGSFADVPNSDHLCEADSIIVCAGQLSTYNLAAKGENTKDSDHAKLVTKEDGSTPMPGFFAGGDMNGGNLTAAQAVADAKITVEAIDEYIRNTVMVSK